MFKIRWQSKQEEKQKVHISLTMSQLSRVKITLENVALAKFCRNPCIVRANDWVGQHDCCSWLFSENVAWTSVDKIPEQHNKGITQDSFYY